MRKSANPSKTGASLILAALGVVFGDIGTSPLYALREAFGHGAVLPTPFNILGILSLIIWALTLIVSLKYLLFVMRADNKGEGGVLALTALLSFLRSNEPMRRAPLILVGIFGAALLFGDGIITPAVTILGAIEGLNVATPLFEPYIVPITITILVLFFWAQHHGTAKIGLVFGPIIFVWFFTIGILGALSIFNAPVVLEAFNPLYAINFCLSTGISKVVVVFGAVFLTTTGAEALYADMGHFGPSPIRKAWYFIAFPGLLLNYLGQGSLLIGNPEAASNPFYHLVPKWGLYPMVLLSTMAAVIASQALITGVFSITQQAIHLGYLPRLRVVHTSMRAMGQIYLPQMNWALLGLTIWLVITFKSSSALVSAYGIAVSLTMLITTILACIVARRLWNWNPILIGILFVSMLAVDSVFLAANALKIQHGGWFPLAIAAFLFMIMTTWKKGRVILFDYLKSHTIPFEQFIEEIRTKPPARVCGTAIFMTAEPTGIPLALLHNVKHNKVLHEKNVFLTIFVEEVPFIKRSQRIEVTALRDNFFRMSARYGFMEKPDINHIFAAAKDKDLVLNLADSIFFLGKETIIATHNKGMAIWREKLFSFMSKNSEGAILFFNLPRQQVVELGVQIEL
jgi:KUP system potassium uptake protein